MYDRDMIFVPDPGWLTCVGAIGILAVVGVLAFLATRRWGWKAWPLLLCSALLVPVLGYAATVIALYYVDMAFGLAGGFVVHLNRLMVIDLVPTAIGAAIGSASRRRRANVR